METILRLMTIEQLRQFSNSWRYLNMEVYFDNEVRKKSMTAPVHNGLLNRGLWEFDISWHRCNRDLLSDIWEQWWIKDIEGEYQRTIHLDAVLYASSQPPPTSCNLIFSIRAGINLLLETIILLTNSMAWVVWFCISRHFTLPIKLSMLLPPCLLHTKINETIHTWLCLLEHLSY